MPYRQVHFSNSQFYHIFGRSVGREKIFKDPSHIQRSLDLIDFYRFSTDISYSHFHQLDSELQEVRLQKIHSTPSYIELLSFALMPTHFHFVLIQRQENGIMLFLRNFQNSYAKYYNIKTERHGSVFSNRFQAVHIESENQLFHVIRYVELNPVTSYVIEESELASYPYTSFTTYMNHIKYPFINTEIIYNHFKTRENYKKFVLDQADYQRSLKEIKRLTLD